MKKRIISLCLVLCMLFSYVPVGALALEGDAVEEIAAELTAEPEESTEKAPELPQEEVPEEAPVPAEAQGEEALPEEGAIEEQPVEEQPVEEPVEESVEEAEAEAPAAPMVLSAVAEDGVKVILTAEAGAFMDGDTVLSAEELMLTVSVVEGADAEEAQAGIDSANVVQRTTYDICVMYNGAELQPVEGKSVSVAFVMPEVPAEAEAVSVYHHSGEGEVEALVEEAAVDPTTEVEVAPIVEQVIEELAALSETVTEENVALVEETVAAVTEELPETAVEVVVASVESFSYYTVEFVSTTETVLINNNSNRNDLNIIAQSADVFPSTEAITKAVLYYDAACTQGQEGNDLDGISVIMDEDQRHLLRVYEEGGKWYLDAVNPFVEKTYGLKLTTQPGGNTYKVKLECSEQTEQKAFIRSALTHETTGLRVSQLLEVVALGFSCDDSRLQYSYRLTSTSGRYASLNMYNNMDQRDRYSGEIDDDAETDDRSAVTPSGSNYRYFALQDKSNRTRCWDQNLCTVTVTVTNRDKPSETATAEYKSFLPSDLRKDIESSLLIVFVGGSAEIKELYGLNGVVHIDCDNSRVRNGKIQDTSIATCSSDGTITGVSTGVTYLTVDVEKYEECDHHSVSEGEWNGTVATGCKNTVYVVNQPEVSSDGKAWFIRVPKGVSITLNGVTKTSYSDDTTLTFTDLEPGVSYSVEASVSNAATKAVATTDIQTRIPDGKTTNTYTIEHVDTNNNPVAGASAEMVVVSQGDAGRFIRITPQAPKGYTVSKAEATLTVAGVGCGSQNTNVTRPLTLNSDGTVTFTEPNDAVGNVVTITIVYEEHQHSWVYAKDGDDTITATCQNPDHDGDPQTLTISASDAVYDGQRHPATLGGTTTLGGVTGLSDSQIKYQKSNGSSFVDMSGVPTEVGTYRASITAGGQTAYTIYNITPKDIGDTAEVKATAVGPEDRTYTGNAIKPSDVVVSFGGKTLVPDVDYTLSYPSESGSNTNAGKGTVYINFKGNYTGKLTQQFNILPKAVTVTADDKSKIAGAEDPAWTATVTGTLGTDTVKYTLDREPGNDVGFYDIIPSGTELQGNYKVSFEKGILTITARTDLSITTDTAAFEGPYDGQPHGDAVEVNIEGATIQYSTDGKNWSATPPTITDVGEVNVFVKASKTDCNDAQATYKLKVTPKAVTVTADDLGKVYGEQEPTLTATASGLIGEDTLTYTVTRVPGEDIGSYTITPAGAETQGNYSVSYQTGVFTIVARVHNDAHDNDKPKNEGVEPTDLNYNPGDFKALVDPVSDQTYTGSEIEPKPDVYDGEKKLVEGVDFEYKYKDGTHDNKTIGENKGLVIIEFKGNYSGSTSVEFNIVPGQQSYTVAYYYDDVPGDRPRDVAYPASGTGTYDQRTTVTVPAGATVLGESYALDTVTQCKLGLDNAKNIVKVYYATDDYGLDKENPDAPTNPTSPDGIPDKYQVKVTYSIINGTWDGNNDDRTKTYAFTLYEKDPDGSEWTKLDPAPVLGATVPDTTKAKADEAYSQSQDKAEWLVNVPTAGTEVAKADYIYSFGTEKNQYEITVSVTHGTADPQDSPVKVTYGEDYSVSFTAADGYALDTVTVDGEPAVLTEGGYSFENVTEAHSISVVYAEDKIGGDDPDEPGDGIPDKYEAVVTFAVENGTLDISSAVVVKLDKDGNWSETGTGYLSAEQIPTATPDTGYVKADPFWTDKEPTTELEIKENVTLTAHYELGKYDYSIEYYFDEAKGAAPAGATESDSGEYGKPTEFANAPEVDGYALDKIEQCQSIGVDESKNVVKVYYATDVIGGEDPDEPGDGIPDKYQAVITYSIHNGKWSKDGDAEDIVKVFNLKSKNEVTGAWDDVTPAPTLGDTLPTDMVPDEAYSQYADKGQWSATLSAATPVTGNASYEYSFGDTQNSYNISVKVTNGTADPSNTSVAVTHGGSYTVSFTPKTGFVLDSAKVDGADKTEVIAAAGKYTFANVNAQHSIEVVYKPGTYSYTVNTYYNGIKGSSANENGTYGVATKVEPDAAVTYGGKNYVLVNVEQCTVSEIVANNVVRVDYLSDEIGPNEDDPANPNKPDGIPDAYEAVVSFKAVNGSVDKTKAVVVKLDADGKVSETGTGYLSAEQIPTATPDTGYTAAEKLWTPSEPTVETAITGNVEFTANFTLGSYDYSIEYYYDGEKDDAPAGAEESGKLDYGQTTEFADVPEVDGYALDKIEQCTIAESGNVVKVYYATDVIGGDDPDEPGDGIPDKYEAVVSFKAENGTLDISSAVVVKYDEKGEMSETGTGHLSDEQIPTATPDTGYVPAEKLWTPSEPTVTTPITDDVEFTAKFELGKYDYSIEYYYDEAKGAAPAGATESDSGEYGKPTEFANAPEVDGYALDKIEQCPSIDVDASKNVVKVYYATDVIGGEVPDEPGDGIPDKYQAVITYSIYNGTWNDTKDNADKVSVFTLYEQKDGAWTLKESAPVLGSVPAGTADEAYSDTIGQWTPYAPTAETPVTRTESYLLSYGDDVNTYSISITVNNGTADPAASPASVPYGGSYTVSFTPDTGFVLDSVKVDGADAALTEGAYTFPNVTEPHSIEVVYKPGTYSYTVNTYYNGIKGSSANENGTYGVPTNVQPDATVTYGGKNYVLVNVEQCTVSEIVANNVVRVDYLVDEIGGDDPAKPGDGIPDVYEAVVSFKAVNGSVDKTEAVVVKLDGNGKMSANGTGYLSETQIPTATPDTGYEAAEELWTPAEPTEKTPITGNVEFTAHFELGKYDYSIEYYYDGEKDDAPEGAEKSGKLDYGQTTEFADAPEVDGYALDKIEQCTIAESGNVVKVFYATDVIGGEDPAKLGDGIPDKYEAVVSFKAENGTLDISSAVVVKYDEKGNRSEIGTGHLSAEQIPTPEAETGFVEADPFWNTEPTTTLDITKDTELTASYVKGTFGYTVNTYYDGSLTDTNSSKSAVYGESSNEQPAAAVDKDGKHYVLDSVEQCTISEDPTRNIVRIDYLSDNIGGNDPAKPGDGIPDQYQAVITYSIHNGTWNDTSDKKDKVSVFTLYAKDQVSGLWNKLEPAPVLGSVPAGTADAAYSAAVGRWSPAAPTAETSVTKSETYLLSYGDDANTYAITVSVENGTANPAASPASVPYGGSYTVSFTPKTGFVLDSVKVDNVDAELTEGVYTFPNVTEPHSIVVSYTKGTFGYSVKTYYDGSLGSSVSDSAIYGDTTAVDPRNSVTVGDKTYVLDNIEQCVITENPANNIVRIDYLSDNIGENDPTKSDNIPDKYQATVTFRIHNGLWSEGGDKLDKVLVFTLKTKNDQGQWVDANPVLGGKLPIGMVPDAAYSQTQGKWSREDLSATTPVTGNASYEYSYGDAQNSYNISVSVTNGTADPSATSVSVTHGESYTVSFKAATGFVLKSVTVDGAAKQLTQDGAYTFANVNAEHSIAVVYEAGTFDYTVQNYYDGIKGDSTTGSGTYGDKTALEPATAVEYQGKSYVLGSIEQCTIREESESNIVRVYYLSDEIGGDDPAKPGDGIADVYEAVVSFKAVNGSVDKTEAVVVKLDADGNKSVNGKGYLSETQIPKATANEGYKAAEPFWTPAEPTVETPITGDVTFTANFELGKYDYSIEYYYDEAQGTAPEGAEESGKLDYGKTTEFTDAPAVENYALDKIEQCTIGEDESSNIVRVYYAADELGNDPEDPTNPAKSDGIPDKYQATVSFVVENGSWYDGSEAPQKFVFTLKEKAADGSWQSVQNAPVLGTVIPAVGQGKEGYNVAYGWNTPISATTPVSESVTYSFHFGTATIEPISDKTYTGEPIVPAEEEIIVKDENGEPIDKSLYDVIVSDNTDAGEATVTIVFKDELDGEIEGNFNILPKKHNDEHDNEKPKNDDPASPDYNPDDFKATVDPIDQQTYTGSPIEPTVTVRDEDGNILVPGKDYVIEGYENNVEPGTGKVKIKLIGNYEGELEQSFEIKPRGFVIVPPVDPQGRPYREYEVDGDRDVPENVGGEQLIVRDTPDDSVAVGINRKGSVDPHDDYPTDLTVHILQFNPETGRYEAKASFPNLIKYEGCSIRIGSAKRGLRIIHSIDRSYKNRLIDQGVEVNGKVYKLTQYGTLMAWTGDLGNRSLTMDLVGTGIVKMGTAFNGATDAIYGQTEDRDFWCNVVTSADGNLTNAQVKNDMTLRPYLKMTASDGSSFYIYGGAVIRSIGSVAAQNNTAYTTGSWQDKAIKELIQIYQSGSIN